MSNTAFGRFLLRSILALAAVLGATALFAATNPPPARLPANAHSAARAITSYALRAPVAFLSNDLLEGRGTSTRGDDIAELYLASTMESLGLEPGGPGGQWRQPFDVVGVTAKVPQTWEFDKGEESLTLTWWQDFIAASGVQSPIARVDHAQLVFVGYGIQAPEYGWDDFKGADLHGKILLILNNDPDWDPHLFAGKTRLYYGRWTYKYESAARQGAVGAIIIHTTPSAGYPWQVVQSSWSGEQFQLPAAGEPTIQVAAWTSEAASRRLVALAGHDLDQLIAAAHRRDFQPVPLGITTSLELHNTVHRTQTANVLGLLPGRDPQLKNQVVIYSAHHDHLGIGKPDRTGDRIYNGALDNAAGDAEVLAIARAYATLKTRPRRSILFLFTTAEEQGLLGSKYYSLHPTFAPGRIAADFNFDGANIWGRTRDITFIGYGKSSLDKVVDAVAASQHRTVKGDQFPDRGYFYRSDQFSLAKIGVPSAFFNSGTDFIGHPAGWGRKQVDEFVTRHYHQPSDELTPAWKFDGMIQDARLGFFAGLEVANADRMPSWKPGDEFEAARQKALAAVASDR